jgi:hypothetical protein
MSQSADIVNATVSDGTGTTTEQVDLSSSSPINGTFVSTSPAGTIGADPLVLYNWDPTTQLAGFLSSLAAGDGANIVTIGDSTSLGFGSASEGFRGLSYSAELTQALNTVGVSSQSANFEGQGNENGDTTDQRVVLLNGATYSGAYDAGGQAVSLDGTGQAVAFTPDTPGTYNQVSVSYIDQGSGSVNVSVDGTQVGTLQIGNTGNTLSQSITIPAGMHGEVTVTAATDTQSYIQGISLANTNANQVQVFNASIGGWGSGSANTSYYGGGDVTGSADGFGQVSGSLALNPKLALIDLGINDITGFTNNGTEVPTSTIVDNLEQIVATYKANGCDVILILPQPFSDPNYASALPALRSALESFSLTSNVPIIDLSATYGNDYSALVSAGLMSDNLHPDATLYADIGTQIANLLGNAINGTNTNTANTVQGTTGNDVLTASPTNSILVGNGGSDTYSIAGTINAAETIINGTTSATQSSGTANFTGLSYKQLWFSQSGQNLVVSVLGTGQSVAIQNWFANDTSKLNQITTSDGTLSKNNVANLVTAMQNYMNQNTSFSPATTNDNNLSDSAYAGSVSNAVQTAWSTAVPCFMKGTLIATDMGNIPVECLKPGDMVLTADGSIRPVVWIGHREINTSKHIWPLEVMPVRVRRDAFGLGLPRRDLWLSPQHAILTRDVLIPIIALANGATIVQEQVEHVSYWHVELETHDVLIAEGLAAESFLDCNTRQGFSNNPGYVDLHPLFEGKNRNNGCAPLHESGPLVDELRNSLSCRAKMAGWDITIDPDLHITVDGNPIYPTLVGRGHYVFDLPDHASSSSSKIRLVSRTARPVDNDNKPKDRRHLGVNLHVLILDGIAYDIADLSEGWHDIEGDAENTWRWSRGNAALPSGSRRIQVMIGTGLTYRTSYSASPVNMDIRLNYAAMNQVA